MMMEKTYNKLGGFYINKTCIQKTKMFKFDS